MTTFPGSPRLLRGALVGIDPADMSASVIAFQYNPETMTRTLQAQTAGEEGGIFDAQRLKGAPVETITLEATCDATDQLEQGGSLATTLGIYPQLSALEMLLYPKIDQVQRNASQLALGMIEIVPPAGLFTVFVWGLQRVLPVRLTEFSLTEEAYDVNLNPIRATVSLSLRVLSYNDLSLSHPGYDLFLAHQEIKEVMAELGSERNLGNVFGIPLTPF